ncbi:divergent polysaccharide deacetylase family protein [Shewanella sp. SR44-3]|uniref:divergent polysaccharide deacetylase family protein n=1 Tax=unclassified Shewanella TaxID=196818 RepID=UPI0015FC79BD|nr:divergent polysaccharide deacetylase family protein [Shewanella sp. SR44-3]MBB1268493.1 divergent polysaccharide deacetylase family protein [Shewanella sp. SR44-3]
MQYLYIFLGLLFIQPVFAAKLAIIIDDIGYRQTDEAVLSLPNTITLSVLPHTPLGQKLAQDGHNNGHEIMLHLPMQALNGKELGPGGLTNDMTEQQIKQQLYYAVSSIPFAKGANNHMGSLLTQMRDPMRWVMQSLKQNNLYFVDSMTTRFTKAADSAQSLGVPTLKRQVFLDNDVSEVALQRQFNLIMAMAKKDKQVIAIAHPYPETVHFLKANLHRLEQAGIELVHTSHLLPPTGNNEMMASQTSANSNLILK